jgi:hypothetical protein
MKYRMNGFVRKLVFSIAFSVSCFVAEGYGQQTISASLVPANTVKAFQATTGGAAATWMAGPNKSYEATFLKDSQKMVYVYDQEGLLQQKKIVSTVSSFPSGVNAAIAAAYPTGNVEYAYKVVNRTNQKFYEVQVANSSGVERMRFDLEGKPLGKTSLAAAQPAGTQPVNTPATTSKPVTSQPAATSSTKTSPPVAMRGEAATTNTQPVKEELEDDLGDLLEDEGDMDDLFKEDETWEDVDLEDDLEDDSDLLDVTDDLDDDLDIEDDLDDEDDL